MGLAFEFNALDYGISVVIAYFWHALETELFTELCFVLVNTRNTHAAFRYKNLFVRQSVASRGAQYAPWLLMCRARALRRLSLADLFT